MADTIEKKEATISVTLVPLELVDDNPFNSRQAYSEDEIKSMAESIKQNGLLEAPEGRNGKDGRVQVAFGHKRLRAYRSLAASNSAEKWKRFPVFIVELTDTQMLDKAIEENLQRSDVKPIEVARALAAFEKAHPEIKDKDIAKKHGMSDAQISNMKRVLKLPQKFLDMIDRDELSFTQGRELLTLAELPDAEGKMSEALKVQITSDFPDTVEGLKKAIEIVNPSKESKKPRKQKENPTQTEVQSPLIKEELNGPLVHPVLQQSMKEAGELAKASQQPENISQEKSPELVRQTAQEAQPLTEPPQAPAGAAESQPAQVEKKATTKPTRTMLLEESEKGVNISFSTAKGGLIIRGVLGNLDTVIPELPGILKEMVAETKGGKK